MSKKKADHHDADLVLRVYDMRRETMMRESRDALGNFWPKTYEDVAALADYKNPLNRPWRQVTTYWEMVYSMVRHGVVNPDFFLEVNGEGFFLLAKVKPFLAEYRKNFSPRTLLNTEWVATKSPVGKRLYAGIEERVRRMAESR